MHLDRLDTADDPSVPHHPLRTGRGWPGRTRPFTGPGACRRRRPPIWTPARTPSRSGPFLLFVFVAPSARSSGWTCSAIERVEELLRAAGSPRRPPVARGPRNGSRPSVSHRIGSSCPIDWGARPARRVRATGFGERWIRRSGSGTLLTCPFLRVSRRSDAPRRRDDQAGGNQQASMEFRRAKCQHTASPVSGGRRTLPAGRSRDGDPGSPGPPRARPSSAARSPR